MELSTIFINISLALVFIVVLLFYYLQRNRYKTKQFGQEVIASKHETKKLLRLLDHSETIIYTHDLSGKIDFINNTVQKLMGFNPNQLMGTSFRALISDGHPRIWDDYIQAIFRDQQIRCEFKLLDQNGLAIPFQIYATGIVDEGVVVAVKGHARLVNTSEKVASQTKSINRPKLDTNISEHPHQVFAHHIKNIFAAIHGFIEIIEEEDQKSDVLKSAYTEIRAATLRGVELVGTYSDSPVLSPKMTAVESSGKNRDEFKKKSSLRPGRGTILYIDDEESLLKMYSMFIEKLGYSVDTCSTGRQAIEILSTKDQPYELIITDWMMPDLSGTELVEKIKEKHPGIPIMLLSGKSIPVEELPQVQTILQKPVDPVILSEKIAELINADTA